MRSVGKSTNDELKVLLTQANLYNTNNFAKAKTLSDINEITVLMRVLAQCQNCVQGSCTIAQACYDKLVSLIKIIDVQNDEDDALRMLAKSGLLSEETIELFAANTDAFNNYAVLSSEDGDLTSMMEGIILAQKEPVKTGKSMSDFDGSLSALKFLLKASGLPIICNIEKAKASDELSTLVEVLAQCYGCESGSYSINQDCYDKLIACIPQIDMQDDEEQGLIMLAASGLLNEETIELFAANPSAFNNEAAFSDERGDLKTIMEGIIQQQGGLKLHL